MVTALRMVDLGSVKMLLHSTRGDALVMIATAVATIAFDLVVAVEIGIVLASLLTLRTVARSTVFEREEHEHVDIDDETEHALFAQHIVTYRLDGALFFGAAQRFLTKLTDVSDVQVVVLRLGGVRVLDSTGAQALGDLVAHLQHRGITVLMCSVPPDHRRLIERIGVIEELTHENHLLPNVRDALAHARTHVEAPSRSA